jgi:hypothetical protein
MTIDPDSLRGRIVYARPTDPWLLLWTRLAVWTALTVVSALTPVYNPDAPAWIWPVVLIACLLMAGQTVKAIRRKARGQKR